MITSKYNFIIPYQDEKYLAYNALTNDLAILEADEYDAYEMLKKEGVSIPSQKLVNSLLEGGFIYQDGIDEVDAVRLKMYQASVMYC